MSTWASGMYAVTLGCRVCISTQKSCSIPELCFRCGGCRCNTKMHLSNFSPFPPPVLANVSESRTWSMYKFCIKALIVGFLFQSVMPVCPREVQSFYQVSWDTLMVAPRQLSSDTINAVLHIWKYTHILSCRSLQRAWGKAIGDVLYNQKAPNRVKKKDLSLFVRWNWRDSTGNALWNEALWIKVWF